MGKFSYLSKKYIYVFFNIDHSGITFDFIF